ncbi:MAG: stage II sporulation protein M [Candidatus Paceibacterota bacterium]
MKNIFKDIKLPFFVLLAFFAFSLWLGFASGMNHPKEARMLFDKLFATFSSLKEVNIIAMFFFIFLNNTLKSFAVVLLGTFFGVVPMVFVAVNGMLIGVMSAVVLADHGSGYLFAGTIPHGILEVPAFLIASSYGLQLGKRYYLKLKYKEPFKPFLAKVMEKMIRHVVPLFAVASFIETFITMTILRSL